MTDITPIVEAILTLLAVVITTILVPLIKSKTTSQQQDTINAWIKLAVTAAEQIYKGPGRGEEKKEYVIRWLTDHNIKIDSDKIDAMIEAAVYDLTQNGLLSVEPVEAIDVVPQELKITVENKTDNVVNTVNVTDTNSKKDEVK